MRTFLRRVLATCFIIVCVWFAGLYWFVSQIPTDARIPERAEAIVVLTGGAGRLELGTRLLVMDKAEKMFVSGANQQVQYNDIVALTAPQHRSAVRKMTGWKLVLGTNAENTIGNAQESRAWLEEQRYNHIILVTSNYHMPRSISEFRQEIPALVITPVAVIPAEADDYFWWTGENYRGLVLSEYYKYIIGNMRHWALDNVFTDITT
ncbi:MAG: YdcF family protein [Alphaproteobacteria bacterium]